MLLELESFALPKILHTTCLKAFMHFSLHQSLRNEIACYLKAAYLMDQQNSCFYSFVT